MDRLEELRSRVDNEVTKLQFRSESGAEANRVHSDIAIRNARDTVETDSIRSNYYPEDYSGRNRSYQPSWSSCCQTLVSTSEPQLYLNSANFAEQSYYNNNHQRQYNSHSNSDQELHQNKFHTINGMGKDNNDRRTLPDKSLDTHIMKGEIEGSRYYVRDQHLQDGSSPSETCYRTGNGGGRDQTALVEYGRTRTNSETLGRRGFSEAGSKYGDAAIVRGSAEEEIMLRNMYGHSQHGGDTGGVGHRHGVKKNNEINGFAYRRRSETVRSRGSEMVHIDTSYHPSLTNREYGDQNVLSTSVLPSLLHVSQSYSEPLRRPLLHRPASQYSLSESLTHSGDPSSTVNILEFTTQGHTMHELGPKFSDVNTPHIFSSHSQFVQQPAVYRPLPVLSPVPTPTPTHQDIAFEEMQLHEQKEKLLVQKQRRKQLLLDMQNETEQIERENVSIARHLKGHSESVSRMEIASQSPVTESSSAPDSIRSTVEISSRVLHLDLHSDDSDCGSMLRKREQKSPSTVTDLRSVEKQQMALASMDIAHQHEMRRIEHEIDRLKQQQQLDDLRSSLERDKDKKIEADRQLAFLREQDEKLRSIEMRKIAARESFLFSEFAPESIPLSAFSTASLANDDNVRHQNMVNTSTGNGTVDAGGCDGVGYHQVATVQDPSVIEIKSKFEGDIASSASHRPLQTLDSRAELQRWNNSCRESGVKECAVPGPDRQEEIDRSVDRQSRDEDVKIERSVVEERMRAEARREEEARAIEAALADAKILAEEKERKQKEEKERNQEEKKERNQEEEKEKEKERKQEEEMKRQEKERQKKERKEKEIQEEEDRAVLLKATEDRMQAERIMDLKERIEKQRQQYESKKREEDIARAKLEETERFRLVDFDSHQSRIEVRDPE